MRKKVISCVVAGALALTVPMGGVAAATDGSYLGNQVEALKEKLLLEVSAEDQASIEAEIDRLLAENGSVSADDVEMLGEQFHVDDATVQSILKELDGMADASGEGAGDEGAADGSSDEPSDDAADDSTEPSDQSPSDGAEDESDGQLPDESVDVPTDVQEDASSEGQTSQQPEEAPVAVQSTAQAALSIPLVSEAGSYNSGNPLRYDYSEDLDTEKFIALIGEQARAIGQENGLYASVMIAQAILESGSGQSSLSQAPYNNLFGIKGAWEDEEGEMHSVSFLTSEDNGSGVMYQIVSKFRAYDTISDSLADYAKLLTEDMGSYYEGAWKENAETYQDAAQYLQGRYATDTSYAEKIVGLIETYDLDQYDEALDYVPVDQNVRLADLLAEVTSHIGTEYAWGGDSPEEGFDCSGLVQYSYKEALDIELSRTTYTQCLEGETVQFDDLHPGDLLFFSDEGDVHHVAVYLGNGFYIHAPQEGECVKVTSMEEYEPSFAKRIVATRPVEEAPVVSSVLQGLKSMLWG